MISCSTSSNNCLLPMFFPLRYDSDNPRVHGDVGMAGVAVDSVEDMKVYLSCSKYLVAFSFEVRGQME